MRNLPMILLSSVILIQLHVMAAFASTGTEIPTGTFICSDVNSKLVMSRVEIQALNLGGVSLPYVQSALIKMSLQ
ncbi:MAG: hypothetical protein ACXVCP_19600 [Bdellovibrio sp.]